MKEAGWDHGDKKTNGKGGGGNDLWKDKKGNVYEKPKSGAGTGEWTGINLNNLSIKRTDIGIKTTVIGIGSAVVYGGIKLLDVTLSRVLPFFMTTPLMIQQYSPNYQLQFSTETL